MLDFYKVAGVVIAILLLGACGQEDRYVQDRSPPRAEAPGGAGALIVPSASPDYSLPPQSSSNTLDAPTSPNRKANPLGEMTKQQESTSMPMPRQANDHSSDIPKTPKK